MLVLRRRPGEWIDIVIPPSKEETEVSVRVVRVDQTCSQIGLGVEAAREVEVYRREINPDKTDEE